MNKFKKIINIFICILLISLTFSLSVSAEGIAPVHNDNTIKLFDYANLLTESEENEIESKIKTCEEEFDYDIVVVLTYDVPYESYVAYADDFFDYNNYGPDGVLFLYDLNNRIIYMSTSGRCINIYADDYIEQITSDASSFLSNSEYYDSVNYLLNSTMDESMFSSDDRTIPRKTIVIIMVISGVIIFLILIGIHSGINSKVKNTTYIKSKNDVYAFNNEECFTITYYNDELIDTQVRVVNNTHSNFGGSSSHRGSSGRSHGGGGSRF